MPALHKYQGRNNVNRTATRLKRIFSFSIHGKMKQPMAVGGEGMLVRRWVASKVLPGSGAPGHRGETKLTNVTRKTGWTRLMFQCHAFYFRSFCCRQPHLFVQAERGVPRYMKKQDVRHCRPEPYNHNTVPGWKRVLNAGSSVLGPKTRACSRPPWRAVSHSLHSALPCITTHAPPACHAQSSRQPANGTVWAGRGDCCASPHGERTSTAAPQAPGAYANAAKTRRHSSSRPCTSPI